MVTNQEAATSRLSLQTSPWRTDIRTLLISAMIVFLITVAIGLLNGQRIVQLSSAVLLTHVHAGTIGWITLSVFAISIWVFGTGASQRSHQYIRWSSIIAAISVLLYVLAFLSGNFIARAIFGVPVLLVDEDDNEDDGQAPFSGPRPPWRRRRGWIIGMSIVLLMILLGGFLLFRLNHRPSPSYQTQRVTQGNLVLTIRATGSSQASTYDINFPNTSTTGTSGTFNQTVDPSVLQVVAYVNESDMANVKLGDPAQFTVSAYSNRIFTGVVSAISPNGVTVSNVVTFPVYVDVDTNDLQGTTLLPGMTANVTIEVGRRTHVLLIPVSAVNFARST